MKPIKTERLILEPVTVENAAALWEVMQSPDLRRYQDLPDLSFEELRSRMEERPRRLEAGAVGRFEWLLSAPGRRRSFGWVSLRVSPRTPDVGEIGYSLRKAHRGYGYATEAVRGLLDEIFQSTDLRRVDACFVMGNLASQDVLERIGFKRRRFMKGGALVRGRRVDICIYALSRPRPSIVVRKLNRDAGLRKTKIAP